MKNRTQRTVSNDVPGLSGHREHSTAKPCSISRHLAYDLINGSYIKELKISNAFRIPKQTSSICHGSSGFELKAFFPNRTFACLSSVRYNIPIGERLPAYQI